MTRIAPLAAIACLAFGCASPLELGGTPRDASLEPDASLDASTPASTDASADADAGASANTDAGAECEPEDCVQSSNRCLEATGTCVDSACVFTPRDGELCGEGRCEGGTCRTGWVAIALGDESSCALEASGTVACWGFGFGATPTVHPGWSDALEIAIGWGFECARRAPGQVACWDDADGEPGPFPGLTDAVEIAAGNSGVCARRAAGSVQCWGASDWRDAPSAIGGLERPAVQLAVGGGHACARLDDGRVQCWGNDARLLGHGSSTVPLSPPFVWGVDDAVEISAFSAAGIGHSCALLESGRAVCWGRNEDGELGDGTTDETDRPVEVRGELDLVELAVGERHTCARARDGHVFCWGRGVEGQLGTGATPARVTEPTTPVFGLDDAVGVASGGRHTCALRASGEVVCWGNNDSRQLGVVGTDASSPAVVPLP